MWKREKKRWSEGGFVFPEEGEATEWLVDGPEDWRR